MSKIRWIAFVVNITVGVAFGCMGDSFLESSMYVGAVTVLGYINYIHGLKDGKKYES